MKSTEVKRGRPAWEDVAQSNNLGVGGRGEEGVGVGGTSLAAVFGSPG